MGPISRTEDQPADSRGSTAAPEGGGATPAGLPAGWTWADLQALADKVYALMLLDMVLERERGAW